ncbi:MAG: AMP-binding protein, partial [Methylococcaceae bacterium]|nr:AMP-binding protein [Methylococcaceae bacterium]
MATNTVAFELSQPLSATLTVLAKQKNVTLFMIMAAAFSVLLSRYSHHKDLTIGYPSAGRNQAQTANLIGFFVNTLVLRCHLQDDMPFSQYLKHLRDQALQDQAHAELTFGQIVEAINPVRHAEHAPLFQVMLAVQNVPTTALQLADLTVTPLTLANEVSQFDLTLFIEHVDGKLQGLFEYNTDLFDASTIENMAEHLTTLLESIVSSPNAPLKQLAILSKQQQQQLLAWQPPVSKEAQPLLIHQLFEQLADANPDKPALAYAGQTLSYQQLNQRANQLAHYLRAQGMGAESRIGVSAIRSAELIIALLAVLKAGAAYIPLDPDYPQQRLDYIIDNAGIDLLLTQTPLLAKFSTQRTVCIEQSFTDYSLASPTPITTLQNTAYIIYTSGSTGQPKGALIEPLTCFLLLSSFAFDSSVAGIFWTLSQGGCLCLPQQNDLTHPAALAKLIHQQQVSHLLALPSFYTAIINDSGVALLGSLKVVIVAGEACSSTVANNHHEKLPA